MKKQKFILLTLLSFTLFSLKTNSIFAKDIDFGNELKINKGNNSFDEVNKFPQDKKAETKVTLSNPSVEVKKEETKQEEVKVEKKEAVKEETKTEEKEVLQQRQFITLEAETGKEFVVIVDYYSTKKEVKFLTELNEDDLRTLINVQNSENSFQKSLIAEQKKQETETKKEETTQSTVTDTKEVTPKKEKKQDVLGYLALGVIVITFGIVFYFKKVKKK